MNILLFIITLIASILIILGHAGLIALIATFANSLRPQILMPNFRIPLFFYFKKSFN